ENDTARDGQCSGALERLAQQRRSRLDPRADLLPQRRRAVRSPSGAFAASQASSPSFASPSRGNRDDQQRSTQSANDRSSGWQIQFVGSVEANDAPRCRGQPADDQFGLERIDQKIRANSRNDQIRKNHKNSADPDETCHDKTEEYVKQEIPCSHGYDICND